MKQIYIFDWHVYGWMVWTWRENIGLKILNLKYYGSMKRYFNSVIGLLLVYIVSGFLAVGCLGQGNSIGISSFLAWNNQVSTLTMTSSSETIPVLLGGAAYRIVKLSNNTNSKLTITGAITQSDNVSVMVDVLPQINNYKGAPLLDVIQPLTNFSIGSYKVGYFLLKFRGISAGSGKATVSFKTIGNGSIRYSSNVKVGSQGVSPLDLNVWAFFNYSLVSGLKGQVINDLKEHGANTLVIPPGVLPSTYVANPDTKELEAYLKGTDGKFDYYLLSLYFKRYNNSTLFLSDTWKRTFQNWCNVVQNAFVRVGIPFTKVMLYPYDEPTPPEARRFEQLYQWCRSVNINIPFYTTLSNPSSAFIAKYAKVVQVYHKTDAINAVKKYINKRSSLWLYKILSPSRNVLPFESLKIGWQAFADGASGIGVWNYADVGKAFPTSSLSKIMPLTSNVGSWNLTASDQSKDYALIYRKGNHLYSSIRWEALGNAEDEFSYLKLYQQRYGLAQAKDLANKLMTKKMSLSEWESIKVSLVK